MTLKRNMVILAASFVLVAVSAALLSVYFSRTYAQYERSIADLERKQADLSKQLETLQSEHQQVQAAYKALTENSVKICMVDIRSTSDQTCEEVAKAVLADKSALNDLAERAYFETVGARYMRQDLFASATGWFEKALEIDPKSVNANVFLGYSLFRSINHTPQDKRKAVLEKALAATDLALKGQPANAYAIINRLKILCALNQSSEAQAYFNDLKRLPAASEAVKVVPTDPELKRTCRKTFRR